MAARIKHGQEAQADGDGITRDLADRRRPTQQEHGAEVIRKGRGARAQADGESAKDDRLNQKRGAERHEALPFLGKQGAV
jgi:hypothetical protein